MKKIIYYTVSFLSFGMYFSALSAAVNVTQYLIANPDPLDAFRKNVRFKLKLGPQIGHGDSGRVYSLTTPGFEQYVLKTGDVHNEAVIGQRIRHRRRDITSETPFADVQGIELLVTGKLLRDRFLAQRKVEGTIFANFNPSGNGWIDSPEKALKRLCALTSSIHALEKARIIHGDLHAQNIMIENKRLPDEVIAAITNAKARQMTGITGEEKDLTEEDKRTLDEAKAIATANLTFEDQYEHIPIIIDFGLSTKSNGTETQEKLFSNMSSLGTLMPRFLFGRNGLEIVHIAHYFFLPRFQMDWAETARNELEHETQRTDETTEEYEARFETELKKKIDEVRNRYIITAFHAANTAMRAATGQFYPELVLHDLAQIMADCLSPDPTQRPTAAEIYKKLTDLTLSYWPGEHYTIQPGIIQRESSSTASE
jgi:serine/threonine protein kinase